MEGCFFLQPLLWLGLLLCLFLHYFILGVSHARLFGQSPFLFLLTAVLPNALELPFEEVQDVFDRLSLPLKIEVENKEGKEVTHVDDYYADGHNIDGMLGLRNRSDNFKPHILHYIVIQPDKDIRIDAGVSKNLGEVVVDEVVLAGEVVEQTQFEGIAYREIRGR